MNVVVAPLVTIIRSNLLRSWYGGGCICSSSSSFCNGLRVSPKMGDKLFMDSFFISSFIGVFHSGNGVSWGWLFTWCSSSLFSSSCCTDTILSVRFVSDFPFHNLDGIICGWSFSWSWSFLLSWFSSFFFSFCCTGTILSSRLLLSFFLELAFHSRNGAIWGWSFSCCSSLLLMFLCSPVIISSSSSRTDRILCDLAGVGTISMGGWILDATFLREDTLHLAGACANSNKMGMGRSLDCNALIIFSRVVYLRPFTAMMEASLKITGSSKQSRARW